MELKTALARIDEAFNELTEAFDACIKSFDANDPREFLIKSEKFFDADEYFTDVCYGMKSELKDNNHFDRAKLGIDIVEKRNKIISYYNKIGELQDKWKCV